MVEKQAGDKVEAFLDIHVELTLSGGVSFVSLAVTIAMYPQLLYSNI